MRESEVKSEGENTYGQSNRDDGVPNHLQNQLTKGNTIWSILYILLIK